MREFRADLRGGEGAAGRGRGAVAAIAAAVLGEVRILNRSLWRAERLRDALRSAYPEAGISVHDATDPEGAARGADVVVNATYLGKRDDDPLPIPVVSLGRNTVVCDAVYRPGGETRFIGLARALRDPRRTDAALPGGPEDMDRQRARRARYEREDNHEPSESMDLVLWSSPGESP